MKDKRRIWLTIVGALIVFIGYFVREHYMEEAKANEERLHRALEMQHELLFIKNIRILLEQQQAPLGAVVNEELMRKEMAYVNDTLQDQQMSFMEAGTLTPLLPKDDSDLTKLRDVAVEKLTAAAKLQSAIGANDFQHSQDREVAVKLLNFTSAVNDSVKAAGGFYTSSLQAASKSYQEEQKNLRILTILEYCCFVLGWLLGIIGKFMGADTETAEA